jgi:hypothetical protein
LDLVLSGYPFAELRQEPPGARPKQADAWGLGYRMSVYSHGRYVGLVERFGTFIPESEDGNGVVWRLKEVAMVTFLFLAPYVAGIGSIVAMFMFVKQRRIV